MTYRARSRWIAVLAGLACPPAGAIVISDGGEFALGSLPLGSDHPFFGVGQVETPDAICTGAPISSTAILTAAHCFEGEDPDGEPDVASAEFRMRREDADFEFSGSPVSHPSYGGWFSTHDVAVLHLATPLPPFVPIYALADLQSIPIGAVVAHAGYGLTGTGSTGPQGTLSSYPYLNVALNSIDLSAHEGLVFETDFDGDGRGVTGGGPLGLPTHTGFVPYEGTTAAGDSGGPTFYNPHRDLQFRRPPPDVSVEPGPDVDYIIGINSFVLDETRDGLLGNYGDMAGFTFVGAFRDWLLDTVAEVRFEPIAFPFPPAPGDPGAPVPEPPVRALLWVTCAAGWLISRTRRPALPPIRARRLRCALHPSATPCRRAANGCRPSIDPHP
jgi:hypothetical protein